MFKISLVICTYNRDKYLPKALQSIKQQTIDKNFYELIVVDNNSTDNTSAIVKQFAAQNPQINCRYCFEEQKGLSFARNRGIKEATFNIITYTDDDALLQPEYLQQMSIFFTAYPEATGVGGKVIPQYEDGKEPIWMSKYLNGFVGKVDYGSEIIMYDEKMKYPAGCNMTYKKDILIKAGGFNNELTFRSDDKYIFYKVKAVSTAIYYNPFTWLYHIVDDARLQKTSFKKLFLKTGNEEKRRILSEKNNVGLVSKFLGYCIKLIAALFIFFKFLLTGHYLKGKYLVLAQWYSLKGFMAKNVFVR